jgi:hypothetical protein
MEGRVGLRNVVPGLPRLAGGDQHDLLGFVDGGLRARSLLAQILQLLVRLDNHHIPAFDDALLRLEILPAYVAGSEDGILPIQPRLSDPEHVVVLGPRRDVALALVDLRLRVILIPHPLLRRGRDAGGVAVAPGGGDSAGAGAAVAHHVMGIILPGCIRPSAINDDINRRYQATLAQPQPGLAIVSSIHQRHARGNQA